MMDFVKAKKKAKRIRQERFLLLIYAFAVTAALIVSIYNNNSVRASTPDYESVEEMLPEEFEAHEIGMIDQSDQDSVSSEDEDMTYSDDEDETETFEKETETQAVYENPDEQEPTLEDMVAPSGMGYNEEVLTIEKGDSFIGVLTKFGLEYAQANEIYHVLKKVYDARFIRVGQEIRVTSVVDGKYNELSSLNKLTIEPVSGTRYIVEKDGDGHYQSRIEQDDLENEVKVIKGTIRGNVSDSMKNAGVPINIIGNFINIFSFSVDFRRDVHAGDSFEVRYERQTAPNGKVVKTGDIIYAALKLGKEKTELYRYKDNAGVVDYYTEKGIALKKTLDRKPMEFKKARISSRFGKRFHPILKQYRTHSGVDYAAPMGTKVYASGDGTVVSSKWVNGYGNYITIRHNSEYSTGYAHLKSFAKGIRPGVRVKQGQVIAYVGNTGRSTGPHLHFEVIKNGRKVDPLKIKAATGQNLTGRKLAEFKKIVAQIKETEQESRQVAENNPTDEIGQLIENN